MWCGPWVVALLLGIDYGEAYSILLADARRFKAMAAHVDADRAQLAKPAPVKPVSVTGTFPHQVERLLNKRGVRCNIIDQRETPITVLRFTRERPVGCFLIDTSDHWIVVEDGMMYNSQFDPVLVEDAPGYRKSKVKFWAEVEPLNHG